MKISVVGLVYVRDLGGPLDIRRMGLRSFNVVTQNAHVRGIERGALKVL
jgi:hypothetical protein